MSKIKIELVDLSSEEISKLCKPNRAKTKKGTIRKKKNRDYYEE